MGRYYETFYPPFFMDRRYAFDAIAVNPLGWERRDVDILEDLSRRLQELEPFDSSKVIAKSQNQILTLRGEVKSIEAVKFLGRVADNILGVREVDNQLTVARAGARAETTIKPTTVEWRSPTAIPSQNVPTDQELPIEDELL